MHSAGGDDAAITGINVTPLVDIILVVLIIFMATAPMIARRAIKVDMPKAAKHEKAATEAVQVAFKGNRELYLQGKVRTREQLASDLSGAVKGQPDLHVTFMADRTLAYGEIVEILDIVRGAGVRKIGLEVQRK
jgi:biopolymer transport protein TolR